MRSKKICTGFDQKCVYIYDIRGRSGFSSYHRLFFLLFFLLKESSETSIKLWRLNRFYTLWHKAFLFPKGRYFKAHSLVISIRPSPVIRLDREASGVPKLVDKMS